MYHSFTESERAEEALKKERDFVSAILDTSGALVVVLDRKGKVVRFNNACEQTTGYSFNEVKGRHIWDLLLPPEELDQVKAVFEKLRDGHFPSQYENYWLARDGSRRLIAWSNTVLLNDDGSVEYVIGTGIDVTDRKQAEEVLRKSEEKAKQLAQENDLVSEIGRIISSTMNIEGVYERFAEKVGELIHFDRIVVNLINMKDYTRSIRYAAGTEISGHRTGDVISLAGSGAEEVLRTRSSLLIEVKDKEELRRCFPGMLSVQSGA